MTPILQQFQPITPFNRILETRGEKEFVHARGPFIDAIPF
jgi:hypothetical protein